LISTHQNDINLKKNSNFAQPPFRPQNQINRGLIIIDLYGTSLIINFNHHCSSNIQKNESCKSPWWHLLMPKQLPVLQNPNRQGAAYLQNRPTVSDQSRIYQTTFWRFQAYFSITNELEKISTLQNIRNHDKKLRTDKWHSRPHFEYEENKIKEQEKGEVNTHNVLNRLNNAEGGWWLRAFPGSLHGNSNTVLSLYSAKSSRLKQEWQQKHKHQHDKKFNWVNFSNLQQYYSDKTRIGSSLCIQQTLQVYPVATIIKV